MLFLADWLTLIVLLSLAWRLLRLGKRKTIAAFTSMWIAGYFGFPLLGIAGGFYFLAYKAVLCLALLFIDLYLKKLGKTKAQESPLTSIQK